MAAGNRRPHTAPPPDRHALTGRSVAIDPRIHAARADLTDVRLAARIFAPHYASAMPLTALTLLPIRESDAPDAAILSELLPGETFEILELSDDRAWGIGATDGVVGYVDPIGLGEHAAPTHRVTGIAAALREAPDGNASALATLPMGARIAALAERGRFLLTDHGYVAANDVSSLDTPVNTAIAEIAVRTIGIAAKPGGRSGAGVDPAGLIALVLDCCGHRAPRFADLQRGSVGVAVDPADAPLSGDLLFFADHVAIQVSDTDVVHVDYRVVRVTLASLADDHGAVVARHRIA